MSLLETFWNQKHPLSEIASSKYNELVPLYGLCNSIQGELLRASSRIGYDYFNNGWGCNNWSGAVVFIKTLFTDLPIQPSSEIVNELNVLLSEISVYSHGEPCYIDADKTVTKLHEIIVQCIVNNPILIDNHRDMLSYQEEDYQEEEFEHEDDGSEYEEE